MTNSRFNQNGAISNEYSRDEACDSEKKFTLVWHFLI